MSEIESLINQQQDAMYFVLRALDNFKKIGKANYTIATVRNRIAKLENAFKETQSLHRQIVAIATPDHHKKYEYFLSQQFMLTHEAYLSTSDFMAEILNHLEEKLRQERPAGEAEPDQNIQQQAASVERLPQLHLPTFSGALDEWESFRDRFQAMIVGNKAISEVSKLQYLFSCVNNEPLDIIRNLAVTDSNFQIAWNLLVRRYENKRRLITVHVQALLNLPSTNVESKSALNDIRDRSNMAIQALKKLGCAVDQWNEILVCLIVNCLDRNSRRAWELQLGTSTEFPRFDDLDTFLESRIRSLEAILVPKPGSSTGKIVVKQNPSQHYPSHATMSNSPNCPLCRANHGLNQCPVFREKTVSQRIDYIKKGKRCINCLSTQHQQRDCKSIYSCQKCRKRHHTLLHFNNANVVSNPLATDVSTVSANDNEVNTSTNVPSLSVTRTTTAPLRVLLATARVNIHSSNGRTQRIRVLLDQGSVASLITENLAQRLKTPRDRVSISITGVGDNETTCKASTMVRLTPCKRAGPAYSMTALIVNKLTTYLPPPINGNFKLAHLTDLDLADDTPFSSDPIEMIIGADLYGRMLIDGIRRGAPNEPVAQNTVLGWILSGPLPANGENSSSRLTMHHCMPIELLDSALRKFWELEQIPMPPQLTPADQECEKHFEQTHMRTEEGRYCVRLPFVQGPPINIGASLPTAKLLWCRQEKRLQANPELAHEYAKFMREYESLNHMVEVPEPSSVSHQIVYIPHHAVIKESSVTTRLRVVFNASSKTSNGTSLNDHLFTGQKLQLDLPAVILQWRLHRYVFLADIEKMYRQILVDKRDIDYQRIVWRASPQEPLRHFSLRTVTYGTAPAPYLALRVLRQLAKDDGNHYPLAMPVLQNQIYVDDCVFGADDVDLARQTRDQLISLLSRAGFTLHKWASNAPTLLSDLNPNDLSVTSNKTLQPNKPLQPELKVLGVSWNPNVDSFQFNISIEETVPNTKRTILSTIAKLFDPLGWVTPVVIKAKIFMQRLWHLKCDWDVNIPNAILDEWTSYYKQLPCLRQLSLPRWVHYGLHVKSCELHGFADASSSAYAAVVYLKITTLSGDVTISLLTAKSKVAPLKSISIPRLELCAAVLLSRLLMFVKSTLALQSVTSYCWTDSTIVLAWVSQHPSRWKTFVANRVAEIQTNIPNVKWHHVPTGDNPADCASRGLNCDQLGSQSIWWTGPLWLRLSSADWPYDASVIASTSMEERSLPVNMAAPVPTWDLADRYSNWTKLLRVTAYIFRFINRLRRLPSFPKLTNTSRDSIHDKGDSGVLSPSEIQQARLFWLKYIQRNLFLNELQCLQNAQSLPRNSALVSLNVYIDADGLIRVGGRLNKSTLPEDSKNPIVLGSHPLVKLLIHFTHLRTLHGGSQLTLAVLRQQFWLLRARQLIRSVLYRCVVCVRERASTATELMGNLPFPRVNKVERAFLHCGVDYAGPVLVRLASGRGHKSSKAYIALFICLTTRAIHLELVSNYSTAAFLAAFERFCSRRGVPTNVYSDNGTNFHGAEKELNQMFKVATRNPDFRNKLVSEHVTWNFIPPSAPHFGGLWEAGVRSVKYHLKRIIGAHTLTFEEFTTLLCQVEACLNSRPIAPVSDNYDDYTSLTPGHFLIGSALNAIPSPTLLDVRETRLSRWQLIKQMNESFWQAWSTDYLHTLQQRPKWRTRTDLAKPGRIVLIRNPLAPPCKWELGRITHCHPGSDGITRVVTVKTAQSEYQRPITKLCFLPVDINTHEKSTVC